MSQYYYDNRDFKWVEQKSINTTSSYTTTTTTGDPIEIKAPEWKIGDRIEINSPIDIGVVGEPKGWICPRCGRVNAPWISQCSCNASPFTKISTSPTFTASP